MSDERGSDPQNRDGPREFHVAVGLRPLSDLLGHLVEATVGEPPGDATDRTAVGSDGRNESRTKRKRTKRVRARGVESDERLVDARIEGDEFVVVADIPGASGEDLSVGVHPGTNEFVIGRNGSVLERIDLPWDPIEPTAVRFNNGVLEARFRPTEP